MQNTTKVIHVLKLWVKHHSYGCLDGLVKTCHLYGTAQSNSLGGSQNKTGVSWLCKSPGFGQWNPPDRSSAIKHDWLGNQLNNMLVGGWANPLKNISQLGWWFPIYGNIKNVPNHQPVYKWGFNLYMEIYRTAPYLQTNRSPKTKGWQAPLPPPIWAEANRSFIKKKTHL